MKRLRQLCAITLLTLALTNVAQADDGTIWPGYAPPPPPPRPVVENAQPGAAGQMEINVEETATDLETEITLLLIRNMLALF